MRHEHSFGWIKRGNTLVALFRTQPIIDVENVVIVIIIITVIVRWLAGLC